MTDTEELAEFTAHPFFRTALPPEDNPWRRSVNRWAELDVTAPLPRDTDGMA